MKIWHEYTKCDVFWISITEKIYKPAIDFLIRGYDLCVQIGEFSKDHHRKYAYGRALTSLRRQTEFITEYEQAVIIVDIKESFGQFIVEAANGLTPTVIDEF